MKNFYQFLLVFTGLFVTGQLYSQNSFWTFPEQYVTPDLVPQNLPTVGTYK